MLRSLSIRDVVLIDRLDLELRPGLSILSGETGAGKSILLDALGLAIGARADSGLVRHAAAQASATASFQPPAGHASRGLIAAQGLDLDDEIVLRRTLSADGRSRAFVNDQAVSIGLLRRIGESLVEIEGQFEQHLLLDPGNHRGLLDLYAGAAATAVADAWTRWGQAREQRREAEQALAQARKDEEFLRHAVGELAALAPQPGEEARLAEIRSALMHGQRIMETVQAALADLAGERSAGAMIAAAQRRLERAAERAGGRLDPSIAALEAAAAELDEAVATLRRVAGAVELDPRRLEEAEDRLFALRDMARKHGTTVDGLASLAESLAGRLAGLEDGSLRLEQLARTETQERQAYVEQAERLSRARMQAAARLDAAVNAELPPLKLEKARFHARCERLDETDWGAFGIDRVVFEAATNPGVPPGPLHRIASGGELSRFMLALKVATAAAQPIPTLIFDEVDAGVGGATAAAVGERLARLAKDAQVLVVTHSPQVAARGHHHWRVRKVAANGAARGAVVTRIEALDPATRREEIARMLSGAVVTDEARAAADRLIAAGHRQ